MTDNIIQFKKPSTAHESTSIESPRTKARRNMREYFNTGKPKPYTAFLKLKGNSTLYPILEASKCHIGIVSYTYHPDLTPLLDQYIAVVSCVVINTTDPNLEIIYPNSSDRKKEPEEDYSCLYCKHLLEFEYATGYYHMYKCPVCAHQLKVD